MLQSIPETWQLSTLASVASVKYGKPLLADDRNDKGQFPVYASGGLVGWHTECLSNGPSIVIGRKGSVGSSKYVDGPFWAIDTAFYLDNVSPVIDLRFLAAAFEFYGLERYKIVVGVPGINRGSLERFQFPLPPISEQRRIVEILQEAEKIRRLREQAITNSSRLIASIFRGLFGDPSSWSNTTKLGDCVKIVGGGTPSRDVARYFDGDIPWATSKDIKQDYLDDAQEHITEDAISKSATNLTPAGTVLIVVKSKILAHSIPMSITTKPFCFGQDIKGMIPKAGFTPEFIVASLQAQKDRVLSRARGVNTEGLTLEALNSLNLPFATSEKIKSFTDAVLEHRKMSEAVMQSSITGQKLMDSILSHAFTGQLTQNWRERHQPQLEQEAQQRDAALQAAGARISRPVRAEAVEARYTRRSDGAYAELTREQHAVLEAIPRGDGETHRWFSIEELAKSLPSPLHGNQQAIASHLAVLAARGLVIAASLEQTTPDTGEIVYGNAYRLPLDAPVIGDRARQSQMERIAAQLAKGPSL